MKRLLILIFGFTLLFSCCNLFNGNQDDELPTQLDLGYDSSLGITGTATDETGSPAGGVWGYVNLYSDSFPNGEMTWFKTADDGSYSITHIPSLSGGDGVSSMDIRLLGFCGDPQEGHPNVYEALWYRDIQNEVDSFPLDGDVYQVDFPLKKVDDSISMTFVVEDSEGNHPPKNEITVILRNHIILNGKNIPVSSLEIWGGDAVYSSYDTQSGLYTINSSFAGGSYDSLNVSWFKEDGASLHSVYGSSIELVSGTNDMGTFVVE